jgi:glycerate kinase
MPLRVLIAPDKFKGTLTAPQAAAALARGWRRARPADELEWLPISDGGDGFGLAMNERLGGRLRRVRTVDAAHRAHTAPWWWVAKTRTALVESAGVIGLAMLPKGRFHPFALDTFGLGGVLRAADRLGAQEILVGIGGSATNDGGFGMARALGWRFRAAGGREITVWTELDQLTTIEPPAEALRARLTVAVDVRNPLLGPRGATRVYGPQKGLRPADFPHAERCLGRLARVVREHCGADLARLPGAGAAGGLGFGLRAFAGARLRPGFELFAQRAGLARQVRRADLVITGEGALDDSSVMGKGVGELAALCHARGIPCVALAGRVQRTRALRQRFTDVAGLTDFLTVATALRRPAVHLARLAERVARRWPASQSLRAVTGKP